MSDSTPTPFTPTPEQISIVSIRNELNKLFGQGEQLFAMEYPTRNLNPVDYSYEIKDSNSILNKPRTVIENEFALSDQLFDISPIVSGPNGLHLSTTFNSLIENYVPNLEYISKMVADKVQLKDWLKEEVTGNVLGNFDKSKGQYEKSKFTGSRIEFANKLYATYLEQKERWENLKAKKKNEYGNDLDKYANWLSRSGELQLEKLDLFYQDAAVRGNLHEVRIAMSYIDVATIAERLDSTKRNLRETRRTSVSQGGHVYPVQMQPSNWFEFLMMPPSPMDILSTKQALETELSAKSNQLKTVQSTLIRLRSNTVTKEELATMRLKVNGLKKQVADKEREIRSKMGDRLFTSVKAAYEGARKLGSMSSSYSALAEAAKKLCSDAEPQVDWDVAIDDYKNGMSDLGDFNSMQMDLAESEAQYSQAQSNELSSETEISQNLAKQLTTDIAEIKDKLSSVPAARNEADSELPNHMAEKDRTSARKAAAKIKDLSSEALKKIEAAHSVITEAKKKLENLRTAHNKDSIEYKKVKPRIDELKKNIESKQKEITAAQESIYPGDWNNLSGNAKDLAVILSESAAISGENKDAARVRLANKTKAESLFSPNIKDGFQEVIITVKKENQKSTESMTAESGSSSKSSDYYVYHSSSSSSFSNSSSSFDSEATSFKLKIALRAAKVNLVRGAWFEPEILNQTQALYRINDGLVSNVGYTKDLSKHKDLQNSNKQSVLKAFPTGFVVVKDVVIEMSSNKALKSTDSSTGSKKSASHDSSWFSEKSSSSASSYSNKSSSASSDGTSKTIRIPGAQIMGWLLQFTDEDKSQTYKQLTEQGDIINAFRGKGVQQA